MVRGGLLVTHAWKIEQLPGVVGGGEGELLQKAGLDGVVLVHSRDGADGVVDEGEDSNLYQ